MINTGLDKSPKNKQIWAKPHWLPQEIGITLEAGNMRVLEGESLQSFRYHGSTMVYELVGLVADVTSADQQKSHLISFVNGMFACTLAPSFEAYRYYSRHIGTESPRRC